MNKELIALCGMNCGGCLAYLRDKNKCNGCMSDDSTKPYHCQKCSIKLCEEHNKLSFIYCYECPKFPCTRLKRLDKRYIEKYKVSLIGNLKDINNLGIKQFVKNENIKWKCKNCGSFLCIHREACDKCKTVYRSE
jgi:hypothetical protein